MSYNTTAHALNLLNMAVRAKGEYCARECMHFRYLLARRLPDGPLVCQKAAKLRANLVACLVLHSTAQLGNLPRVAVHEAMAELYLALLALTNC